MTSWLLLGLLLSGCSAPTRDDVFVPPPNAPAPKRRVMVEAPSPPPPELDSPAELNCVPAVVVGPSSVCRNKGAAKHYYKLGVDAFERNSFHRAAVMFFRANHFCPASANAYNIARAYRALRRNACTSRHLRAYLDSLRLAGKPLPTPTHWIRVWLRRYPPTKGSK